ncbi:hypothetical protein Ciccas_009761 [Cichlidogyrus casuarinus]|uniref:Uncharacterized protein n=1 Tax=Cichlidogyrus casuarinus TaxID=1844966 RepID=A0ABD2PW37_9PLAT
MEKLHSLMRALTKRFCELPQFLPIYCLLLRRDCVQNNLHDSHLNYECLLVTEFNQGQGPKFEKFSWHTYANQLQDKIIIVRKREYPDPSLIHFAF